MRKNTGTIMLGICVIALGFALMGNAVGLWDVDLFFDGWWTLFLILPAISSMTSSGINFGNIALLLVGVALLLEQQDIFRKLGINVFGLIFAFGVILIGLSIITGGRWNRSHKQNAYPPYEPPMGDAPGYQPPNGDAPGYQPPDGQDIPPYRPNNATADFNAHPSYFAMFSGTEARNASKAFTGGSAVGIFGGVDVDLSDISVAHSCVFDATAIFGGVDIVAPRNVPIRVTGVPIFGAYSNKAPLVAGPDQPYLTINCVAIFGGVEIR